MEIDRQLPRTTWSRAQKIVRDGDVFINGMDEDKGLIEAKVYGTYEYEVQVGVDEDDDACSCAFFAANGYCKHIAAVVIEYHHYLGEKRYDPEAATSSRRATFGKTPRWGHHSSGADLMDALNLPTVAYFHGLSDSVKLQPLALEVTLFVDGYRSQTTYQYEARYFVTLRCGRVGERLYTVGDMAAFLKTYQAGEIYQASAKTQLVLARNAFPTAEREVLDALVTAERIDNGLLYSPQLPRKRALLRLDQFTPLVPAFTALAHLKYQAELNGPMYDTFHFAPYTPATSGLSVEVARNPQDYQLQFDTRITFFIAHERLAMRENQVFQMTPTQNAALVNFLGRLGELQRDGTLDRDEDLRFGLDETPQLREFLRFFETIGLVKGAGLLDEQTMVPHFALSKAGARLELAMTYDYDGKQVADSAPVTKALTRNALHEAQAKAYLESLGFARGPKQWHKHFADGEELYRFFTAELPNLRENGVVTMTPELAALLQPGAALKPQVAVGTDAGLLTVAFSFDGITDKEVDHVLAQLDVDRPYVTREDGGIVLVDDQLKRVAATLTQLRGEAKPKAGKLKVSAAQALVLQSSLGTNAHFDQQFKQIVQDLREPAKFPVVVPASVTAKLRPYQVAGVQWLEMLDHHGFGGILADEMGLGKTVQLLTFLAARHEAGHPDLIVVPASLLYNWQAECAKFVPTLKVQVIAGTKAEREALISANDADILITGYSSILRDVDAYNSVKLGYLVLDEAQYVKNGSAKTNQALRKLTAKNTFALSGTPVENRPEELRAIFAIVMPGLLPGKRVFGQLKPEAIALRVSPFIMRREKAKVLKELPAKSETNLTNEMTKAQKTVYLAQLQQMQVKVQGLSTSGLVKNKLAILAGLTRLRQICDTPSLYLDGYRGGSGKLEQLGDLVASAMDAGKQVLVFSQFTKMLDQIAAKLTEAHAPFFLLKGDTPPKQRLQMADAFNAGERPVFLVSLKAGGTGLNLTGASVVILVDLWWNPAVEDQATGRAHRIGQKHSVDVYRLITKGTIEEQIVKLQAKKRDLVDQVLGGADNKAGLSAKEIKMILGIPEG